MRKARIAALSHLFEDFSHDIGDLVALLVGLGDLGHHLVDQGVDPLPFVAQIVNEGFALLGGPAVAVAVSHLVFAQKVRGDLVKFVDEGLLGRLGRIVYSACNVVIS